MPASMLVLIAMTVVVAGIALYRKIVTRREDEVLHIADPSGEISATERNVARSLKKVDNVGIVLTIVTALYGIVLLAVYLYNGFMQQGRG
jgi:hypothetical protein